MKEDYVISMCFYDGTLISVLSFLLGRPLGLALKSTDFFVRQCAHLPDPFL